MKQLCALVAAEVITQNYIQSRIKTHLMRTPILLDKHFKHSGAIVRPYVEKCIHLGGSMDQSIVHLCHFAGLLSATSFTITG